jgi:hypothetical protein
LVRAVETEQRVLEHTSGTDGGPGPHGEDDPDTDPLGLARAVADLEAQSRV